MTLWEYLSFVVLVNYDCDLFQTLMLGVRLGAQHHLRHGIVRNDHADVCVVGGVEATKVLHISLTDKGVNEMLFFCFSFC